jgi:DNA-binding helix-hairpin-helix protein with protein kinase domain
MTMEVDFGTSQDISYKKFLVYHRGKSIVSDGPSPPSVQPPEEEELFPTPFPHIPVGGRLAHFLNQWQLITSGKWAPSILRMN